MHGVQTIHPSSRALSLAALKARAKMTNLFEENRAKWTMAARKAFEYVKGKIRKAFNYVKSKTKSDHPWWFVVLFCVVIFLGVAAVVLVDLLFTARALSVR